MRPSNHNIILLLISLILSAVCALSQDVEGLNVTKEVQPNDFQCPPWFFYNDTTNQCECFSHPSTVGIIECTREGALLRYGYCSTYEQDQGLFVARCNYFQANEYTTVKENFIVLPNNISELNDYMCGPLNRKGRVCSKCVDGYGPPIFSVVPICSNCTSTRWYGVPLYLFLEFVPITIFYFIVLFFRINVTSAPMVAFALYCQIAVISLYYIIERYTFDTSINLNFLSTLTTLYGIWNLDFLRYNLPPFCVSSSFRSFHITYLSCISAFYPLILTITIGVGIKLYSYNNKPIV